MAIQKVKRFVRRIGSRLGLMHDWSALPRGGEQPASWYDDYFAKDSNYHKDYPQFGDYFMWCVIADRLRRDRLRKVLEIGCGTGQLAGLLLDQGVEAYTGLDFSEKAVAIACARHPAPSPTRFVVGDARTCDLYDLVEYDAIICTEVLEHIEDDLLIVSRFAPGKRCLCSVPNFPYPSHVRHFLDDGEVAARYGPFFDDLDVMTLRGPRTADHKYFLFDGIRNGRTAP